MSGLKHTADPIQETKDEAKKAGKPVLKEFYNLPSSDRLHLRFAHMVVVAHPSGKVFTSTVYTESLENNLFERITGFTDKKAFLEYATNL